MRCTMRRRQAWSTHLLSSRRRAGAAARARLLRHSERTRLQRRGTQDPPQEGAASEAPRALHWPARGLAVLRDACEATRGGP